MTLPDPYPGGQYPAQAAAAFPVPPMPQPQPAQFAPGAGQHPQQGQPYPAAQRNNTMALTSLVLGIVGMLCCGAVLGIPAVITGVMAKRQIADSGGAQSGDGQALWGIILGAVSSAFTVLAFIIWVVVLANSPDTYSYSY
ncbi:DUF4190 domain-containing protein [Mycolicibacterium sp.]|uniref:DUF4190 domain-containing protein n=1 Tax=Mycolicibacterium sp. TaxID=2320850 RepID=UPI00355FC596